MTDMRLRRKVILFSILAFVGGLAGVEIALRAVAWVSPRARIALSQDPIVKDRRLGWRPSPYHPDHDRKGFRNRTVPEKADLVALGDSQTYGVGVSRNDAWPQQLAELAGIKTYNMAFGGYGPAQCLLLLDEALELNPHTIVFAFYGGNDLYDSFAFVHKQGLLPDLARNDELAREAVALEKSDSLEARARRLHRISEKRSAIRKFLADHSYTYGLLRALKRRLGKDRNGEGAGPPPDAPADDQPLNDDRWLYHDTDVQTILTPAYRLCVLDAEDPRMAVGQRISLDAIRRMKQKADSHDTAFLVLLLPTKELVFSERIAASGVAAPKAYDSLVENEQTLRAEMIAALEEAGIEYVDALPALRKCLAEGVSPYPSSADGHPNAAGQKAIAKAVAAALKR